MSKTPWIMFTSSNSKPLSSNVFAVAFISPRRSSRSAWPRHLSSTKLMGQTRGKKTKRAQRTRGTNCAANRSWLGPVKIADGATSPKMSTTETERMIANHDGTSLSRKSGKASFAQAFVSSNVTKRAWLHVGFIQDCVSLTEMWPEIKGKICWAYCWSCNNFSFALAWSSELARGSTSSTQRLQSTFKPNSSNEVRPSVNPAARAAHSTQIMAPAASLNHSRVPNGKTSSS
mmetsp:Transcript_48413/g.122101  ORF Transcript_48413/g.122101 Transcript_48413/m.122101 type:complete len:231 (+) Transcript_48413:694-1386(+)